MFFCLGYIRSMTFLWPITLEWWHPGMPPMFLTPLVGTLWSGSGRPSAPLLRGLPTLSWCTVETMARNSWPWGLSSMLWKLFICWLTWTPFRLLLMLSSTGIAFVFIHDFRCGLGWLSILDWYCRKLSSYIDKENLCLIFVNFFSFDIFEPRFSVYMGSYSYFQD